ncbi:DUF72 domain-containing protein [Sphingomonas sp. SFZ2018-12]|uniref:DUF72 domain-containing protein n=1 Tax=Sphingomonas sp. SFZ2018-12 TaxID=2683197 RepID=UPI001F1109DC|nr:DUF72 domain-containing protein [Sphingomonas sp. SFZ2018-12]MCH4893725.1 DUF72 domain-containing protein [Sphingomonas sp. SFZ2018-12]
MTEAATIRVGIGGWTYAPWRGPFYPDGLPQKREFEYATRAVTAIEINATYHGTQKRESFANWARGAPDGFVFAVKASRYATNRRVLAEAGESIEKFLGSGVAELGDKLGPILWQFMATKKFDADDFGAFLKLLPGVQEGVRLRHAVQVRHDSFHVPSFVAMCRDAGVAIVYADSADYPAIADVTAGFVYARLENARAEEPAGYAPDALDRWTDAARTWAEGGVPEGLPTFGPPAPRSPRETFVFMINGAKERAPAAARAVLARLGWAGADASGRP